MIIKNIIKYSFSIDAKPFGFVKRAQRSHPLYSIPKEKNVMKAARSRLFQAAAICFSVLSIGAPATTRSQLVESAAGASAADITAARDQFRVDLGGGTTAGANGSFGGLRREINWDGVPGAFSAPNNLPANFFNSNSPRGAVFSTPGTGFQVSGATTDAGAGQPAAANFGNIDPSYTTTFATFSPQRLFTSLGSNVYDVNFFLPGTNTPALVTGFGAVFSDVDLSNTTSLQFFDSSNASLGTFFVPAFSGSQTFSFLGVSFPVAEVSRVRVTAGNTALGAGVLDLNNDLVVADDFLYGEPVPEPAITALLACGLGALLVLSSRRARR
jgi:hypothetical protein